MGKRIDSVIRNRIMRQDIDALVEPFVTREDIGQWRGEFWGKWFLSLVDAWNYTHDPIVRRKLDEALQSLLKTQDDAGLITASRQQPGHWQHWDLWSRRYTLAGILAYYASCGGEQALRAARRLADYTLDELARYETSVVQTGLYQGLPSSTIIEPLVDLYRLTKEQRYLDHAESIVRDWRRFDGPRLVDQALDRIPVADRNHGKITAKNWWSRENGVKSYEMMSCYEALCHLYQETGRSQYLTAAVNAWQLIRDDEIMVSGSGSMGECWCHGRRRQLETHSSMMESCTAMLWIKLSLQVLQLTNDPAVADEIERTFLNAYLHSMKPDGAWFCRHNPLTGITSAGDNQCEMEQNCCVANGPRVMMLWPRVCVMKGDEGPIINFYGQYTATVSLPSGSGDLMISVNGDYPRSGNIDIHVEPSRPERFALRLRVPSWCDSIKVSINGEPCGNVSPGTYMAIDRTWNPGDRIQMSLGMNPRLVEATDHDGAVHQAAMFGPLLLARDKRIDASGLDHPLQFKPSDQGRIKATPCPPPNDALDVWAAFQIPVIANGGETIAYYCDYASAGNTWGEESEYQVWNRADGSET